jgi:hypothetical protein
MDVGCRPETDIFVAPQTQSGKRKGRHLGGDGLSVSLMNSTVPSSAAALLLLIADKTHLVRQGGGRSDAQSGSENHRHHGTGRVKLSQALKQPIS